MTGVLRLSRSKSSMVNSTLGVVGNRQEVQHGVRGAARRQHDRDGVQEGLAGHDVARAQVFGDQFNDALAGLVGLLHLAAVHGRRVEPPGSIIPMASMEEDIVFAVNRPPQAPRLGRPIFEVADLGEAHVALRVGADCFEDALDGDLLALVGAGQDRCRRR